MIVWVRVVVVSIAFADAWKLRCAVMRLTSASVISTFDLSKEPERIFPKPSAPASPTWGDPETAVSGSPQVGEAGAEGFGNILSGSLERSNVDITEELVNLITAQRNFQASAKAIETTTTLTQTIINIRQ